MEVFINELSIQEQYHDGKEFEEAVIIFTKIVSMLNDAKCDKKLYKKGDFYWNKRAISNSDFRSSLSQIRDKFISSSFKRIVFDRNNPKDWLQEQIHSNDDDFFSETLNCKVTGQSLAEVSERKTQNIEKEHLLLNFHNSSFSGKSHTNIIKNNIVSNNIDCIDSISEIASWIEEKCPSTPIVEDSSRFERTSKTFNGATIYKEKNSRRYWYLDTLHKNHYEVFNAQKEHLGEADLEGNIDISKKDSSKNGKIDI